MLRSLLLILPLLALPTSAQAEEWELLANEDGIVVHEMEVEGRDLPKFRGVGRIYASIYEIMAVLADTTRRTEWLHKCVEAEKVRQISTFRRVVYNRTDAPWPVADRDVVLLTNLEWVEQDRIMKASFKGIRGEVARRKGTVRMPRVKGHYILTYLGEAETLVEYMVDADPGGDIPKWLARQASKELPLKTLQNLRRQLKRTKGQYDAFLRKWDPSRRAAQQAATP